MRARHIAALSALAGLPVAARLGRRSGVTSEDLRRALPGDTVVADPWQVVDRAAILPAPAGQVWPWIRQIGKDRGGWYAPRWLERALLGHPRSARVIDPALQVLPVGAVIDDWGPGGRLELLEAGERHLVYGSVTPGRPQWGTGYHFSWLFLVEPLGAGRCRLYIRLRFRRPRRRFVAAAGTVVMPLMGFADYLTAVMLVAGLRDRLRG